MSPSWSRPFQPSVEHAEPLIAGGQVETRELKKYKPSHSSYMMLQRVKLNLKPVRREGRVEV